MNWLLLIRLFEFGILGFMLAVMGFSAFTPEFWMILSIVCVIMITIIAEEELQ